MDKQYNPRQSGLLSRTDIESMLARFLDGTTTAEEEQCLARYFRETYDLPDEWQVYRDMFAYFDDCMPLGKQPGFDGTVAGADINISRRRIVRRVGLAVMAAAAVVALLFVLQPRTDIMQPETSGRQHVYAQQNPTQQTPDTLQTSQPEKVGGTKQNETSGERKPEIDRRFHRHRYGIAPPKSYYASVETVHGDSATAAATEMFVAEQRNIVEEQRHLQDVIKETQRLVEEVRTNLVASENYDDVEY